MEQGGVFLDRQEDFSLGLVEEAAGVVWSHNSAFSRAWTAGGPSHMGIYRSGRHSQRHPPRRPQYSLS